MKKILSALLCICFVFSFLNITTFAAKKENLCEAFNAEFYPFPNRTGEYVLTEDSYWQRADEIDVKDGRSFPADVVMEYATIAFAFENYPKYLDEETNIYTVPEKEFLEFLNKHFNKFDSEELRKVTSLSDGFPTYYNNGNYVFKGPLNGVRGKYWHVSGYRDLGNNFYEVYVYYAKPEDSMSDTIAKSRVSYIDNNIKFYSFEKINSIPDDLITSDTVFEETESSEESLSSGKTSSDESGDESEKSESSSKKPVSSATNSSNTNSTSKKPQTSSASKKPSSNTSNNSTVSSEKKNSSFDNSKLVFSNQTSSALSSDKNTSSDTVSTEQSNGISVSLGSERNDSANNTSNEVITDEIKTFAETESAKIEAPISVFPENTTIEITEVSEGETYKTIEKALENKASKWKAFDITAKNNNVSVQPDGKVTLTLLIPDSFDLSLLEIWYIADNGEIEVIPSVVDSLTKTVTAELSHFSSYVMVENAVTEEISFSSNSKKEQNKEQKTGNNLVWIIIAVVAVLLIAGALCWYFLFFKKKKTEV